MKPVIFLSLEYPPKRGGISTYSHALVESLRASGRSVHLIAPGFARLPSAPLLALPFFAFHLWRAKRKHPEASVFCTNWMPAGLAAALLGTPYHLAAHGSEIFPDKAWRTPKNWLRAFTLRKARKVFAVSRFTAGKVKAAENSARVEVIPNGVNTDIFTPADHRKIDAFTVVTVCRLEKHKGVDTALRALAPLLKSGKVSRYRIAGTGREEAHLRALARELGIEGSVDFLGNVADASLPSIYRDSSLLLLLSREEPRQAEGFGLVFLEAAACGLTCVGSRSGGIPDAVLEGETGILVPADDVSAARVAVENLIDNPERLSHLAARARERARRELNWLAVARRIAQSMEKKKVCCFSVATHLGGAERSLLEYLRFAKHQNNAEIELLFPKAQGALLEAARQIGIPCRVITMPSSLLAASRHGGRALMAWPAALLYVVGLVAFFRRERFDLVYTTGIKCHVFGALAGALSGTNVAWHLRDHLAGRTRGLLRLLSLLPNMQIAANSKATAASLGSRLEPAVIYNGINPSDFPLSRSRYLRELLHLESSTRIVGIVGVLARWKGQAEFLKMAAALLSERSDLHFVVVGEQIYDTAGDQGFAAELRQMADSLGIQDRVTFLGYQNDPSACIRSLDVLVHASLKPEPFGRVIIEAMACGTPVAASAAGGPLEIIGEEEGLFHPPGDISAMAENVKKLLHSNFAEKISSRAYEKFRRRFTHEQYSENLHRFVVSAAESRSNS